MMDEATQARLRAQLEEELARLEAEIAALDHEERDEPVRGERGERLPRSHGGSGHRDVRARDGHDVRGERPRRA